MEKNVTVVMSAYNHEKYVEKAIKSVLNQTYKGIYFMVADDASTDDTVQVLLKYESEIDEIHLFDVNSGGGRGTELIARANTKYIARMNSDDYWEENKIEKQVQYMEEHPECAACFTWCNEIDENGEKVEQQIFQVSNRKKEEWMAFFWENGNCLAHPSILIRTDVYKWLVEVNNGVFRQLPDWFMWLKVIQKYEIHIVQENLVNFLHHKSNASENVSAQTLKNQLRHHIETGAIWYKLMKEMDDEYFVKAFKHLMKNPKACTSEEIMCEKFFVLEVSPIDGIQDAAIRYYYDVFLNPKTYEVLSKKYGYSNKMFYNENLEIGTGKRLYDAYDLNEELIRVIEKIKSSL